MNTRQDPNENTYSDERDIETYAEKLTQFKALIADMRAKCDLERIKLGTIDNYLEGCALYVGAGAFEEATKMITLAEELWNEK